MRSTREPSGPHRLRAGAASRRSRAPRRSIRPRPCAMPSQRTAGTRITWRERDDVVLRTQCVAVRAHWATGGAQFSPSHHRVCHWAGGLAARRTSGAGRTRRGAGGLQATYRRTRRCNDWSSWRIAAGRIEPFYEDAKGEWGLDHYQGRRWDGLPRHLALVMLAYSFLARQRWTPADPAGFSPRWGAAVVSGGPPPRARVALPGRCVVAHRDQPNRPVPSQADLTK